MGLTEQDIQDAMKRFSVCKTEEDLINLLKDLHNSGNLSTHKGCILPDRTVEAVAKLVNSLPQPPEGIADTGEPEGRRR